MKGAQRPTLVQAANKGHLARRIPVLDLMNLAAGDDGDAVFPALFLPVSHVPV